MGIAEAAAFEGVVGVVVLLVFAGDFYLPLLLSVTRFGLLVLTGFPHGLMRFVAVVAAFAELLVGSLL